MISEGSCESEDWSNDAENFALITETNYILLNIQKENVFQIAKNISQYAVFCIK